MYRILRACLLVIVFSSFHQSLLAQSSQKWILSGRAQGTTWSVVYFAPAAAIDSRPIDSLLKRLDSSLSLYLERSLINRFNLSLRGLPIDQHFKTVVKKSLFISKKTHGLFDITVKPLVQSWGFAAKRPESLPDSFAITRILSCVGWRKLAISKQYLSKSQPCVEVDLNGIAQGYSVDCIAQLLEDYGITNYVAEIGGEIRVRGHRLDGSPMRVGIESPVREAEEPSSMQRVVELTTGAITTSGSYRKYFESEGRKISHIINPKTGFPVATDLIAVTIYAEDAITADGYDNAVLAMGLQKGMKFIEKHPKLAAFFIYKDKDGNIQTAISSKFRKLLVDESK